MPAWYVRFGGVLAKLRVFTVVYLLLSEDTLVFRRPKVTLMYYIDYELLDEVEQNIVVLSVDGLIIVLSFSYKASLKTL